MGEDYTVDDNEIALIEMLSSPVADVREQGWRIVLWRYGLPLKKYVMALLNTRQMPTDYWEDVAQKTYSTAIELFVSEGYKGQPLYPWLCSIAKNHLGNLYRQEQTRSRRTVEFDLPEDRMEENIFQVENIQYASPEDVILSRLHQQQQTEAFRNAQAKLSKDERRLLDALMQYPHLSLQELGTQLGENPKTLRNKKSLLIKKLKVWITHFQQVSGGESDD